MPAIGLELNVGSCGLGFHGDDTRVVAAVARELGVRLMRQAAIAVSTGLQLMDTQTLDTALQKAEEVRSILAAQVTWQGSGSCGSQCRCRSCSSAPGNKYTYHTSCIALCRTRRYNRTRTSAARSVVAYQCSVHSVARSLPANVTWVTQCAGPFVAGPDAALLPMCLGIFGQSTLVEGMLALVSVCNTQKLSRTRPQLSRRMVARTLQGLNSVLPSSKLA